MSSKAARYIREMRQTIVDDIITRHGHFDPHILIEEAKDPDHEAHGWFEWNLDEAAQQHWLTQAREFVRGLKITAIVRRHETGAPQRIAVAPRYVSDPATRREGGGYQETTVAMSDPAVRRRLLLDAKAYVRAGLRRHSGLAFFSEGKEYLEHWQELVTRGDELVAELAPADVPKVVKPSKKSRRRSSGEATAIPAP
jgi:hypothetical protein